MTAMKSVVLESDILNITNNSDYIRYFTMGESGDQLDLTTLLAAVGYYGLDPVADGYLQLDQDGNDVRMRFDIDGYAGSEGADYMGKFAFVNLADFSLDHNLIFDRTAQAPQTITGTSGDDDLVGEVGGGILEGQDGDDDLTAQGGQTTMIGGAGQDTLFAGPGEDTILFEDDLNNILANADTIHDFRTGVGGDVLDVSDILDMIGYSGSDPIADGYLEFDQDGADTEIFFDADAAGAGARELLGMLVDTQATDIIADNLNII